MTAIRLALSTAAILTLTGCASLQVRTDHNPHAAIERSGTYSWDTEAIDGSGHPALNSPLLAGRIRHAVDSTLAHMGYHMVTTGTPDFRVTYRVDADRKTRTSSGYGYGGYGYGGYGYGYSGLGFFGRGYRGLGYGSYYGGSRVVEYVEATLVLDVVDARTNELVWRGWGTERLHRNPRPERVREFVAEAVKKILEEFPPRN